MSNGYDKVIAAASGFGKDVVPRLGGLLDVQPITDVIEIKEGGEKFCRPIYAGNAIATVSTSDKIKLLTVRATNFEKLPANESNSHATTAIDVDLSSIKGTWV